MSTSEESIPTLGMSQLTMSNNSPESLPRRVNAAVPLKIATSTIPGAGRGLFVLEDVKAGDIIFSIAEPLICVVSYIQIHPAPILLTTPQVSDGIER